MKNIIKIINDDCLKILPNLDKKVDLIITDPPYWISYQSNRRKKKLKKIMNDTNKKKTINLIKKCLEYFYIILNNNRSIYLFVHWKELDKIKPIFEKYFKLKNIIIWQKNNHWSGDLKGSYAPKYEMILYWHKWKDYIRWKRLSDILYVPKIPPKKLLHPAQKPVELIDIFIEKSSDEWFLVLDPFLGSGTTAISALKHNRSIIWIEIDKEYYNIAKNRINDYIVNFIL